MSAAMVAQSSAPIGMFASMPSNNNSSTMTAVQSGPYTKAQFQHTMEGSRTIKSSKEVENLLRDYPAALELYRTGKYKVKVKCDADVERVILVEKRISKTTSTNPTSENQENNQTVPDITETEKSEDSSKKVRSRTQSQDRVAPSVPITGNTLVPTAMSSIRMTSNTQPKVEHHRTPSRDREVSVTPPQKVREQKRSKSRDIQNQGTFSKQQGKQMNYEQQKMMVPFAPNPNNSTQVWQQQQRPMQPYYSNPLLQQQQARGNFYMPPRFVPPQNQVCRQGYCYTPRSNVPASPYQSSQTAYPLLPPTARSVGKSSLYSTNNYASSRSVTNAMALPPSFRTFHSNQQCMRPFAPVFQQQVSCPVACPWPNMSNEPISALVNPNVPSAEQQQQRSARNRTRSVDVGPRNQSVPARSAVFQQQVASVNDHRRQQRLQAAAVAAAAAPVAVENKNQKETTPTAPAPAPTAVTSTIEKLTVRQLSECFMQANPSGRVPYSSLPGIIQRFGIALTENDVVNAGKELEYNVNDTVSARRFIHILVKLGKITKSTQQAPRRAGSPSILPEDREVKDIMTQHKVAVTQNVS